jgi:hypothetical protein
MGIYRQMGNRLVCRLPARPEGMRLLLKALEEDFRVKAPAIEAPIDYQPLLLRL